LKDLFPNTNFLGIRILESGDSGSFIRLHSKTWEETEALKVKWKKERCVVVKNSGYHTYIGLSGSDLSNRSEFEVDEGATKAKIKSAFVKSLRTKKTNKKVLNEFVSMIA
jgi:sensor c-di-GMP phosphodiesterase-like protein